MLEKHNVGLYHTHGDTDGGSFVSKSLSILQKLCSRMLPQSKKREFALSALMEIPTQYKATIELYVLEEIDIWGRYTRYSTYFITRRRRLVAAPQGGAWGNGATMIKKVGEESLKPASNQETNVSLMAGKKANTRLLVHLGLDSSNRDMQEILRDLSEDKDNQKKKP